MVVQLVLETVFYNFIGFTFLFFEITIYNYSILTLIIIPVFGIFYELIELVLELAFSYFENKKQIPGSYAQFISEPIGNVFQDVIADTIGAFIGLIYTLVLLSFF